MEISLVLVVVLSVIAVVAHGIGFHRGMLHGYNSVMSIRDQEEEQYEDTMVAYADEDGYLNINGETVHISEFLRESV